MTTFFPEAPPLRRGLIARAWFSPLDRLARRESRVARDGLSARLRVARDVGLRSLRDLTPPRPVLIACAALPLGTFVVSALLSASLDVPASQSVRMAELALVLSAATGLHWSRFRAEARRLARESTQAQSQPEPHAAAVREIW
jgi:hypothetical protein